MTHDAATSSPLVTYWAHALPPALVTALAATADGLAACPNFWVPWVSVEG